MCYSPYPICVGRKFRKTPQLHKPLAVIFLTNLCNKLFLDKDKYKISFLQHVIRSFYRDSLGFRVSAFFKNGNKCKIENNDVIHLVCTANKSSLKKLLSKIRYEINDYKALKRRKYTLNFTFFFCKCENIPPFKNITLDITCNEYEMFTFFITTDLYYSKDFIQLLFFYYIEERRERPVLVPNKNEIEDIDKYNKIVNHWKIIERNENSNNNNIKENKKYTK